MSHTKRNNIARNGLRQIMSVIIDHTGACFFQTGNSMQDRCLARSIGTDQGDNLPVTHLQAYTVYGVDRAI